MSKDEGVHLERRESAFQKRIQTFAIINVKHTDLMLFFNEAFHHFNDEIYNIQRANAIIKVSACLSAEFEKVKQMDDGSRIEKQTIYTQTENGIVDFGTNLERFYQKQIVSHILTQFNDVITTGSGFNLSAINELIVHANRYQPLQASSYIPLPHFLMKKRLSSMSKIRMYSALNGLYYQHHPSDRHADRVSKYIEYENELNFMGIEFPMKINQIYKLERLNDTISINVYHFDSKTKAIL